MPNPKTRSRLRWYPAALAIGMLLLLLALSTLNAFNLHFLEPSSTGEIYLFTAISVLSFLLLIVLIVLLARNILKMLEDQQSRVLGSRLRTRMTLAALVLSLAPALFMFLFSYLLMNRSIDRWFSEPSTNLREASTTLALDIANYTSANARVEAQSLANTISRKLMSSAASPAANNSAAPLQKITSSQTSKAALESDLPAARIEQKVFENHRLTLQGGFVALYENDSLRESYQIASVHGTATLRSGLDEIQPSSDEIAAPQPIQFSEALLEAARRSDDPILNFAGTNYSIGVATLSDGGLVIVGMPLPPGLDNLLEQLQAGAQQYWMLYRQRRTIRSMYLLMLLMLTALVFFSSSWLALYFSKQITRPVEALADAMSEISQGRYHQRVTVHASHELGQLVRSFNEMAADLEQSRLLANYYTEQISSANQTLEARRNELETILETIPSAVLTLDADRRVLGCNRAFSEIFRSTPCKEGTALIEAIPAELQDDVLDLMRRARRMGVAHTEVELRRDTTVQNLALTLASVNLYGHQQGTVLVIENVTELLRAQRQVAWKEVAQRVAHEIKNPLTPVTLSAERIRRHNQRNSAESPQIIERCCDIILSATESIRRLVDQFGVLAEFPVAILRTSDLNSIVERAVLQFENRLEGIHLELRLADDLPPIMADQEALKRALANLIDNAAEAMQDSLLRSLTIETCLGTTNHRVEIIVADTGPGLNDQAREQLFLPYFSTKQRGTGLGLTIAAKIVQDHGGTIRAEQNSPAGTRFVLELPWAEQATNLNPQPQVTEADTK